MEKFFENKSIYANTSLRLNKMNQAHNNVTYFYWQIQISTLKSFCNDSRSSGDHLRTSFLILGEFRRINQLKFPLKSSENRRFSDDFMKKRSYLIRLNLIHIRSKI